LTTNQAVFWIGTASFEINSNANAKDTMKELMQNSINIWQFSELYILGRIAEREKNYESAINYYEQVAKKTKQPSFAIRAKLIREKSN
jgi:TolA-binding protein